MLAWLAALVGTAIGAATLLSDGLQGRMPDGTVALVGSRPITRAQWERAIAAVDQDRKTPLDAPARRAVLQRLVDEELLFQHALDSGLARDDPGLRKTLIAGLIDATTAGGVADEDDARALFEQDPLFFAAQPRLRFAVVAMAASEPAPSAEKLRAALHDGVLAAPLQPLERPAQPLTLPKIAQRIGGTITEALRTSQPGTTLGPFAVADRRLYAMLLERVADRPRYEEVAAAVRVEWERRQADAALERLLQTLRRTTPVRIIDAP